MNNIPLNIRIKWFFEDCKHYAKKAKRKIKRWMK